MSHCAAGCQFCVFALAMAMELTWVKDLGDHEFEVRYTRIFWKRLLLWTMCHVAELFDLFRVCFDAVQGVAALD